MKIALIQPPSWGIKSPPFASAVLAAFLKSHGHEVYKQDANIELYRASTGTPYQEQWRLNSPFWGTPDPLARFFIDMAPTFSRLADDVVASGARLVGFTTLWSSVRPALHLSRLIKKRDPSIRTVFGGPQCSREVEGGSLPADQAVDFTVHGEGEETLLELADAIAIGRPTTGIRGLSCLVDGRVIYGGERPLIGDLDALPFADYDGYDLTLYEQLTMLPVSIARGCPNRCVFCDEKKLWGRFRSRSGERAFAEVRHLVERYGISRFEFCDSLVNGNIRSLETFCDLLIGHGRAIEWMAQATVHPGMTRELLAKIKQSGCFHLCFGMEHTSKPLLQRMGKLTCLNADFDQLIRDCHAVGLGTGLNWMFGFPGETPEDFQADLDFFTRNAPYMTGVSVNPSPGFCGFTKGCAVFESPESFGLQLHENACYWESLDGTNTYPVRLDKYQRFCRHLQDLGVTITFPLFDDEDRLKGEYYAAVKGDHRRAVPFFLQSLRKAFSADAFAHLAASAEQSGCLWQLSVLYRELVAAGLSGHHRYQAEKVIRQYFPFLSTGNIKQLADGYDLVMVQAPAWGINTPPMATAALTAFMRQQGERVLAQDLNITMFHLRGKAYDTAWNLAESLVFWNSRDDILAFAEGHRPYLERWADYIVGSGARAIGFTIYNSSYYMSLFLADLIKERNPAVTVIFGGPFVSRFMVGATAAAHPPVDVVVDGEGELTLLDICNRLKRGESLAGCPGTFQKGPDGAVIDHGERELLHDLDSLPFPDFSDYALSLYAKAFTLPAMSSRGCPNSCIFCNERPFWKTFRGRSATSIFAEMRHQLALYSHISFFEFHDSLINGNVLELEKLCDLIIADELKVQWAGQAAIRKEMTYELLVKLNRAGCISLGYGLESASTALMAQLGKNLSRGADPNSILENGHLAGVQCSVNFIFGLPGETEEDFQENLRFLARNKDYIGTVNPSPAFCGFSPGTKGYDHPEKYGICFKEASPNAHLFWEADNGANNYEVRLQRFEAFCSRVAELGIETTYPHVRLLNRDEYLREYHLSRNQRDKALPHLFRLLEQDSGNMGANNDFLRCWDAAPTILREITFSKTGTDRPLVNQFRDTVEGLVNSQIARSNPHRAEKMLEGALQVDTANTDFYLLLANLYLQRRNVTAAEKVLETLVTERPDFEAGHKCLQSIRTLSENAVQDYPLRAAI